MEEFLKSRSLGEVGIDVGCGNGKYLGVNKDVFILGSDRSDGLINCAKEFGHEVMVADGLNVPHPDGRFDFAISIAVIHHFSTEERRIEVLRHIMSKLRAGGQALVYVWALEQENSRRGYKEGMPQDVLVPWVLQKKQPKQAKPKQPKSKQAKPKKEHQQPQQPQQAEQEESKQPQQGEQSQQEPKQPQSQQVEQKQEDQPDTKYRYYHLYRKGELESNVAQAGFQVVRNGYERDNWYAVIQK